METKDMVGEHINAKIKLHNYRYPRRVSDHHSGEYAIINCDVIEILSGQIPEDANIVNKASFNVDNNITGTIITIIGKLPKMVANSEYIFDGVLVIDKEYGPQFQVESIRLNFNMEDINDQKKFFKFFMTDNQIETLFNNINNPIELLEQKNIGELIKIKGIGSVTAAKMCLRYEECKDKSRAYVLLADLGLTKNAIDKIVEHYGSADMAVEVIEENPYILIKEVRGYGWKKADAIALAKGFTRNCKERVLAYTQYYLDEQAESNGNSWVSIQDLLNNVAAECDPIEDQVLCDWIKEAMCDENTFNKFYANYLENPYTEYPALLYYDREHKKVGLLKLRLLEKEIARHFKRLKHSTAYFSYSKNMCEQIIKEVEEEQGFEYTSEQRKAIYDILDNNVSILSGGAGCVDCDTEYFNGYEWKKISEYTKGEKILTYNSDGSTELLVPEDYVKLPSNQLWSIKSKYGVDMCLSEEHNVYYITSKNNLYHKTLKEIKECHEKTIKGFSGKFITTFNINRTGISLSDAEILLMLAVICDGSFTSDHTNLCRFHFKKERKKNKIREILRMCGLLWREHQSVNGYTDFYCYVPRHEKEFTSYWYDCSARQLQIICNNILFWDGSEVAGRKTFSANNKANIDFVQYAYTACGYRAVISQNNRSGQSYLTNGKTYIRKSIDYNLSISNRILVSIGGFHKDSASKIQFQNYVPIDGYKYCFTVPSHMWIMRRGGKIMITGNTGKSTTVKAVTRILEYYNQRIDLCALSGKASSLLNELTGSSGKTIHRLLAYNAEREKFSYNEKIKLPANVIILDEASMVGGELFLSLIQAIKDGSKFIMLGDFHQLEAIGFCNILKDCMSSRYINTVVLTQIHRQAAKSGIVTQSLKISAGESLVKNDMIGADIRGELKDFKIVCSMDPALVQMNLIKEFKQLYFTEHIPLSNIQVVAPMRTRGDNSCRVVNASIQAIVNSKTYFNEVYLDFIENGIKYKVCFKPNDKIIVTRNNYHALGLDGKEKQIFNGNTGYIKDISDDAMIINLREQGEIILPRDKWYDIQLGYCISIHKSQGSTIPYVIMVLDTAAYALFSKELVYTGITRASKYCVLITQPKAVNTAVRISRVKTKQTWLSSDLYNLYIEDAEKK